MDRKRFGIVMLGVAALALFAAVSPNHRADIQVLTHDLQDANPRQMRAAVDVGLFAVSVLVTWTERLSR
jgi:hypothetical protein